jgi:hypothetical protein
MYTYTYTHTPQEIMAQFGLADIKHQIKSAKKNSTRIRAKNTREIEPQATQVRFHFFFCQEYP